MMWIFQPEQLYKLFYSLVEIVLYTLLLHRIDRRYKRRLPAVLLFLGACVLMGILELQYLPIIPHCLSMVPILLLYAWGMHDLKFSQCLYFAVIFNLIVETGKVLLDILVRLWPFASSVLGTWILPPALMLLQVLLIRTLVLRDKSRLRFKQMAVILIPYIPYLYIRNLQYSYMLLHGQTDIWSSFTIAPFLCACSALGMILLNENSIMEQLRKHEAFEMQALLKEQQKQYEIKREVIDEVNRKYHDLKHYMQLASENGGAEAAQMGWDWNQIGQEILSYACFQHTQNETLDILLTEKNSVCEGKGIRLISYVDGSVLGFVEPLDICVLFGNAVDNAIEAVESLNGEGMKDIRVKIGRSGRTAVMHFHNYFDGHLKTHGGRLVSTKKEEGHGYGLRSMKRVAEKYGGSLAYESTENTFMLTIALPMPDGFEPEIQTSEQASGE